MHPQDFELFKSADSSDPSTALRPPEAVLNELVRSKPRLILTYTLAGVLGYLSSLLVCAQCSIGFTALSWKTMHLLHQVPDPWCPLICGAIYGIFPFLASLLVLNRFQHRYLLFKMPWVPLLLPVLGSGALILSGPVHDFQWHLIWFAAALSTPYLAELTLGFALRQRRLPAETY